MLQRSPDLFFPPHLPYLLNLLGEADVTGVAMRLPNQPQDHEHIVSDDTVNVPEVYQVPAAVLFGVVSGPAGGWLPAWLGRCPFEPSPAAAPALHMLPACPLHSSIAPKSFSSNPGQILNR